MGKHSHQILIGPDSKMIASARWIGSKDSARPVVPGKPYLLPRTTKDASDINEFGSAKALASVLHSQHPQAISPNWNPGYAEGFGAYPFSLSKSHPTWRATESFSLACETVFETIQIQHAIESLRSSLTGSLQRIRLSRTAALNDVNENIAKGGKAPYWQLCGELTLTYQSEISAGSAFAELHDYEGKLVVVDLDPDLTCAENAQLYFAKAKKAKRRAAELVDKQLMLTREVEMLASFLNQAEVAQTLPQLLAIRHKLVEDRWLKLQSAEPKRKVEDPFGGHRIKREIGYKREEILVGQSATANDYLIQRVARPNDIWLHVRGHTSAHVLIKTQNKPEKVDRKTLELAAKLCVANSATKHSSLVSVDYTLAKYVRKPKGSKPGSVIYTHEKTIDVSS
jgi:predicted ribosome quality control (RQC) complex YloA/Tae2 family protein